MSLKTYFTVDKYLPFLLYVVKKEKTQKKLQNSVKWFSSQAGRTGTRRHTRDTIQLLTIH